MCSRHLINTCFSKARGFPFGPDSQRDPAAFSVLGISHVLCHKNHRLRCRSGCRLVEATSRLVALSPPPSEARHGGTDQGDQALWTPAPASPAVSVHARRKATIQNLRNQPPGAKLRPVCVSGGVLISTRAVAPWVYTFGKIIHLCT